MAGFQNVTAALRKAEAALEKELAQIRAAIAALGAPAGRRGPGRPKGSGGKTGRRTLSAKARKAISDAQKARWAKQKAGK
jgi:hypothetical protein